MALSIQSIYQPLTDFFLTQFQTDAGSPMQFRFDKFGSVISDQDFIDPNHPEAGYLPALATEKFSDLVNHIPIDAGDGVNIVLSADLIDSTYFFRILSSSMPFVPSGIDDSMKQATIETFSAVKAECLKIWENLKLESITGLMLQYKPSLATPANWYDKSNNDIWTSHLFQISETASDKIPSPPNQLWKLKLRDFAMLKVLQLPPKKINIPDQIPLNIVEHILKLKEDSSRFQLQNTPDLTAPQLVQPVGEEVRQIRPFTDRMQVTAQIDEPLLQAVSADRQMENASRMTPEIEKSRGRVAFRDNTALLNDVDLKNSVALHTSYLQEFEILDVSKKLILSQFIGTAVPTEPVRTNSISISFDYCLVNIRRPWYVDAFINEKSWCIPTVPKGQLTTNGPGVNLAMLPIGFVAIRNLNIEANWTSADITSAATATDFGPFKVATNIVDNKLSHPGMQIIGWMLQKMPDLPPNDSPV